MLSNECDRTIFSACKRFCRELGLNDFIVNNSWENYMLTKSSYILEGEQLHWLAVSIYVNSLPDSSNIQHSINENVINLPKLLLLSNSSIFSFISKSRKWADVNNLSAEFRRKIDDLEHSLAVTANIFAKYRMIFANMFCDINDKNVTATEILRYNKVKKLMEFGWILFLSVKSENSDLSHDLVNSYHLLLACCDFIYTEYISIGEPSILNPSFTGLPEGMLGGTYSVRTPVSIIDCLCQLYNGLAEDTKFIKEYSWNTCIKQYFEHGILRSSPEDCTSILNGDVLEYNCASITKRYQLYITKTGSFDERLFLSNGTVNGLSYSTSSTSEVPENGLIGNGTAVTKDDCNAVRLASTRTPLTGKLYLQNGDENGLNLTPVKAATQSVARLHLLLNNRQSVPSPALIKFINSCDNSLLQEIETRVETMASLITSHISRTDNDLDGNNCISFAMKRLHLTKILYYKILEDILLEELHTSTARYKKLLHEDVFHKILFACSSEIVIYSYSLQPAFLFLFGVLQIHAFHFYKIIEIIVRRESQLSRDIVKHLQMMEEHILDHLSWQDGSPLWEILVASEMVVPTSVAVSLPHEMEGMQSLSVEQNINPNTENVENGKRKNSVNMSLPKNGSVRTSEVKQNNENRQLCGIGSLQLFFRKFYYLAAIRMQDLCDRLNIADKEVRRRMWTCFEHTITANIHIIRNRHLDQILMCTVYVICKISVTDISFQDIMKVYRNQPQAASHIYRNVLISVKEEKSDNSDMLVHQQCKEERGDLIKFYNQVFVKFIQNFAMKFCSKSNQERFMLSPLPVVSPISSPNLTCRISDQHSVYIRCLENSKLPQFDGSSLKYCFNRSPAKDLQAINKAVQYQSIRKRLGNENDRNEAASSFKRSRTASANNKLQDLIEERVEQIFKS